MRKNILGAFVIFVVTIAIILMIDDINQHKNPEIHQSAQQLDAVSQQDLATTDLEK